MIEEPPPAPPPGGFPPPPRKGLHPLAWVGIGCGGLLVLAVAIVVMGSVWVGRKVGDVMKNPEKIVEFVINANPDLEVTENDTEARRLTIRHKSSGETVTVSYDDIEKGIFQLESSSEGTFRLDASKSASGEVNITTPEGTTTLNTGTSAEAKVPAWVPRPGGDARVVAALATTQQGKESGNLTAQTRSSTEEVAADLRKALEAAGFTVESTSLAANGAAIDSLKAVHGTAGRQVSVVLRPSENGGDTTVVINYSGESAAEPGGVEAVPPAVEAP